MCRQGDTWFFAAVPGIEARYAFAAPGGEQVIAVQPGLGSGFAFGGARIVTLCLAQARYLRRLDGALFLGDGCDLYLPDGELAAIAGGDFAGWRYTDGGFERFSVQRPFSPATLAMTPAAEPFAPRYAEELCYNGPRRRWWHRLAVDSPDGFVEIPGEYDVAQVYNADGTQMLADAFYTGRPWRLPASLLYGQTCWLVQCERRDDFYQEP